MKWVLFALSLCISLFCLNALVDSGENAIVPSENVSDQQKDRMILRIPNPEPGEFYGIVILDDRLVTMETLLRKFQEANPKQKEFLIIQAADKVPHGQIIQIMELAKRVDIKVIGFSMETEVPKETPRLPEKTNHSDKAQNYNIPFKLEPADWAKRLQDPDPSIAQEAKKQLLNMLWKKVIQPGLDERKKEEGIHDTIQADGILEKSDILLSDIDGNGTKEIIVSISVYPSIYREGIGYVIVIDESSSTIQVIKVGGNPVVTTTDLLGQGKQALIFQDGGSDLALGWYGLRIYQWEQGKFIEVWSGITAERGGIDRYSGAIRARIQIVDLNHDGIREIVRIGEGFIDEPVGPPFDEWLYSEGEPPQAKVEMELGSDMNGATKAYPEEFLKVSPEIDFNKIEYQLAYRFREEFFWNKNFKHYIQYVARITEYTTAFIGSEAISIGSGTLVGVLSSLSADRRIIIAGSISPDEPLEEYILDDIGNGLKSDLLTVIMLDGRIVLVNAEKTEYHMWPIEWLKNDALSSP